MSTGQTSGFFDDEDFLDHLTILLSRDPVVLRQCAHFLSPEDFKPLRGMNWGRARWVYAERILRYYQKYHEPIGKLLRSDVLEYARQLSFGDRQVQELKDYLEHLRVIPVGTPDALVDQVTGFKRERQKAQAIQELTELQGTGKLTDEKWFEVTHKIMNGVAGEPIPSNYLEELEDRLERRILSLRHGRRPLTFIDPLDSLVQSIGPKELGLILAPYKRGKSLLLLWLAIAYIIQRLNVLYITLEDPKPEVEDRLDAIITHLPLKRLIDYPKLITTRFKRFRRIVRTQLRIVDGTEGGISIAAIEKILLEERTHGFHCDALIVDYDDEIVPPVKQKERRFEFADIYRSLRQLASKYNLIVWTAAQTQRDTEGLKIISGDRAAEDISKLRKVSMAIGIGKGDWEEEESLYLYVAAHKFDRQHVGCNIVPDLKRMLIFDRDRTRQAATKYENSSSDDDL